jgi:hypothetical protein
LTCNLYCMFYLNKINIIIIICTYVKCIIQHHNTYITYSHPLLCSVPVFRRFVWAFYALVVPLRDKIH